MRRAALAWMAAVLTACGPAWAPPNAPTTPCETVSESEYNAAREAGAVVARARVHESGMVDMTTGPGVVHCATYSSTMRPCRRPKDLVIAYEQEGAETFYVLVPANAEYRFNVRAAPNTCQIVRQP